MSLRDLVDRKAVIKDEKSGIEFEVRGLSLEDVVLLLENHKDALQAVFANDTGTDFDALIKQFPGFVAAAIAYAAGEHDLDPEAIKHIPVGIQIRAITEVWELSSLDVETVGKLAANLLTSVSRLNSENLQALRKDLTSGSPHLPRVQNS